jgi:hypothetical protein
MTNKEIKAQRHALVDNYKLTVGCHVCGYNAHPSALCFDHQPEHEKSDITKNGGAKRTQAGGMYRLYSAKYSTDELLDEIKKCKVMCHNCHMEHTHSNNTRRYSNETHTNFETLERELEKLNKEK